MKQVQDLNDEELENFITNYKKYERTADAYYLAMLAERGRRKGKGLDFDTTMRTVQAAAKDRRFVSYKQLSDASGVEWSKVRYAMNRHLQELIEYCHRMKWPLLSSIVVTKDNLETGAMDEGTLNGFVTGCKNVGYPVTDAEAFLRNQQERVFDWAQEQDQ